MSEWRISSHYLVNNSIYSLIHHSPFTILPFQNLGISMNYIDLINHFWRTDEGAQFTGWETKLYFYLIKTANSLGWVNVFWHSDSRVSANVGMSVNTMKTSRNRLKQAGLIDFVSGGKGHGDKTRYQILPPVIATKTETETKEQAKRRQKLTANLIPNEAEPDDTRYQNPEPKLPPKLTPKLTPKVEPKPAPLNKLNETKLKKTLKSSRLMRETDFEKKNENAGNESLPQAELLPQAALKVTEVFTKEQLKADLLSSELCKMAAKNNGIQLEAYPTVVDYFVETKFGLGRNKKWKDITDARENFMYWLPYYQSSLTKKHGRPDTQKTTGRQIVEQPADNDSVVEQGADGVLRRVSGTGVQTFAG